MYKSIDTVRSHKIDKHKRGVGGKKVYGVIYELITVAGLGVNRAGVFVVVIVVVVRDTSRIIIITVDVLSQSHEVGFLAGCLGCGDDFITIALGGSGIAVRKRVRKSLEVRALSMAHATAACIAVAAV